MTTNNKTIGNLGEKLALDFLKNKKHKLIFKNYNKSCGEIDIIVVDPKTSELVFVEVKTRTSNKFGFPENAVGFRKKEKLAKTAGLFLKENKIQANINYRFDIVSVELNFATRKAKLTHFKYV